MSKSCNAELWGKVYFEVNEGKIGALSYELCKKESPRKDSKNTVIGVARDL